METKLSTKIKKEIFIAAQDCGINKKQGIVILDLKAFERMKKETERLKKEIKKQKELAEIKRIVEQGEIEYREGKTIKADSLKDALKIYK